MPYIGASNLSSTSFRNLKEKHSISRNGISKMDKPTQSRLGVLKDSEEESSASSLPSIEETTSPKSRSETPSATITKNSSEVKSAGMNVNKHQPSNQLTKDTVKSSKLAPEPRSPDMTFPNLTDTDIQQLYTIPNGSTHSYSYNPLSPNSLAVRLSILKRSLEIIIGNPNMLVEKTLVEQTATFSQRASIDDGSLDRKVSSLSTATTVSSTFTTSSSSSKTGSETVAATNSASTRTLSHVSFKNEITRQTSRPQEQEGESKQSDLTSLQKVERSGFVKSPESLHQSQSEIQLAPLPFDDVGTAGGLMDRMLYSSRGHTRVPHDSLPLGKLSIHTHFQRGNYPSKSGSHSGTLSFDSGDSDEANVYEEHTYDANGKLKAIRRFSLSASDNVPPMTPLQTWTSPTAALNAFVTNTNARSVSGASGLATVSEDSSGPATESNLQDRGSFGSKKGPDVTSRFSLANLASYMPGTNGDMSPFSPGSRGRGPGKGARYLSNRSNSLAFLPQIMGNYDAARQGSTGMGARMGNRRVTSRISFRQPFGSSVPLRDGSSTVPGSSGVQGGEQEHLTKAPVVSVGAATEHPPDEVGPEVDNDYINKQRSNLMNLLDLLNETLEKNTSSKASDLHMLSLFNINKLILDKDINEMEGNGADSNVDMDEESAIEKSKKTLRLKEILLDSLAEPFFERNVRYEDELVGASNQMERGLDDFMSEQGGLPTGATSQPQQNYSSRMLSTFSSLKSVAQQAIFTCSQQHPWKFLAANDLACLIFGINKNVLKALCLLDLIHMDSRSFVIHKILTSEGQEYVFTGEIIGIIQPGTSENAAGKNKGGLIWASIWARRKNGILVCVFDRVPCDYMDVLMNCDNFEVTNVIKKSNNLLIDAMENPAYSKSFNLGAGAFRDSDDEATDSTDTDLEASIDSLDEEHMAADELHNRGHTLTASIKLHNIGSNPSIAERKSSLNPEKKVKFPNEIHDIGKISRSLAALISDVRRGVIKDPGDDDLTMPVRVSNHINSVRYFTINNPTTNIPCAVSSSLLQNELKLKLHSLPYIAGLFIIDSQSLNLISFNRSVAKNMFGHHFNELVNRPITDIIPSFQELLDFTRFTYPALDITLQMNRGLVLTEHFFRKLQAEMRNDPESFYTSTGIDGLHRDGFLIKVDIQLRVISPSVALVWITHSRDVDFEDYEATPSQLSMLKESELAYMSSGTSSVSSSKRPSTKVSVGSLKDLEHLDVLLKGSESQSSLTTETTPEKSPVEKEAPSKLPDATAGPGAISTPDSSTEELEVEDPEVEKKLSLAKMYRKDKTMFVKEDNFKVDESLIISKINTASEAADKEQAAMETSAADESMSSDLGRDHEPVVTFLRRPSAHIGAHKRTKKFSDFVILQKMGEGAYGKVNLCMHRKEKYIVVIKMIFKERILVDTWVRDRKLGTIPSEIQIMATLNKKPHENILRLLDFFEDDDYYYIETPIHGETGCIDLFDLIEFKTNMNEYEAKLIFKQIVSGIGHLHSQGIVHRDIKDENVIVDSKGFVKIVDLGSAAYVKNGPFDVFVGTIDYAAPEVLSGDPYAGKPQDIWALGIHLYTIIFKENPFYNIDEILEGDLKFDVAADVSQDCIDLITKILNRNVQKRPTIDDINDDKWLVL